MANQDKKKKAPASEADIQQEAGEKTASAAPEAPEAGPVKNDGARPSETDGQAPKKEADSELEKLKTENAALAERNLRLMAEFDNYRKRTQKERESIYPDATAAAITKLLPVLDNFHRALEASCADENYVKGVQMTYDSFWSILQGMGVEQVGAPGDVFDPNLHNAVMHIDDDKLDKNVVAQVFQLGYKLGDRVLRHAMVQVAN